MTNDPCQACGYSPTAREEPLATILLDIPLISGNKIGHNEKGYRGYQYRKARDTYKAALRNFSCVLAQPGVRRRVRLTRQFAGRKRDFDRDNLVWGCKPLLDVLRQLGWLFDDNPKHVETIYDQHKAESDGIRIEISELK